MFRVDGSVHASNVTHLIVSRVLDLIGLVRKIGGEHMPVVTARGDEVKHSSHGPDSREPKAPINKPRDIYIPDLHIDTISVKARNFR